MTGNKTKTKRKGNKEGSKFQAPEINITGKKIITICKRNLKGFVQYVTLKTKPNQSKVFSFNRCKLNQRNCVHRLYCYSQVIFPCVGCVTGRVCCLAPGLSTQVLSGTLYSALLVQRAMPGTAPPTRAAVRFPGLSQGRSGLRLTDRTWSGLSHS